MPPLHLLLSLFAAPLPQDLPVDAPVETVTERVWHLGNDPTPEWPEAPTEPDGQRIELVFESEALAGEGLLIAQQRHVNNPWHLSLNGVALGSLETGDALRDVTYELPAGTLVDGPNTLVLEGDVPTDDITFGRLRLVRAGWRELLDLREVTVLVREGEPGEAGTDEGLPARITVVRAGDGGLQRIFHGESLHTAVREGVIYTATGTATFELPAGRYEVYAARGTEWSMARTALELGGEDPGPVLVPLGLVRELDTTGFVACDTHVHTLTHSGHGDSSVEERLVTLAGEGVELAIATDHNHNTDYAPLQREMELEPWFTPVVGNEVTTPIGHLNAFPLDPDDPVPPYELHDIVTIVDGIRLAGAEAVILNHPRWPSHTDSPHGHLHLDHASGDWVGSWACPFDALELINSQTEEPEPLLLFRDWFALLNRGERLTAVGSSDSHTVGGVVGAGRTYLMVDDSDVAAIDVSAAAAALREGRSSISMGIVVDARLPEEEGGGSILGTVQPPRQTELVVQAPSWVTPWRMRLFANGQELAVVELEDQDPARGFQAVVRPSFDWAWPWHDFHMVAIVEGDGVEGPFWPQLNDYTLAATNPVWFDVDGDGVWRSPDETAAAIAAEVGLEEAALREAVQTVDDAVAVQLLKLARTEHRARTEDRVRVERLLDELADGRPGVEAWVERSGAGEGDRK